MSAERVHAVWALPADVVTLAERMILTVLAWDCEDGARMACPGLAEVAKRASVDRRRIRRLTRDLEDTGRRGGPLLHRVEEGRGRGWRAEYLVLPTVEVCHLSPTKEGAGAPLLDFQKGGAGAPPPGPEKGVKGGRRRPNLNRETSHPSGDEVSLAHVRRRAGDAGGSGGRRRRSAAGAAAGDGTPAGAAANGQISEQSHPLLWQAIVGANGQPAHFNSWCKIHSTVHEQTPRPCPVCDDPADPLAVLQATPCDAHTDKACDRCMAAEARRRWPR